MATEVAQPKVYDPVKALEGMFGGSVTRIAYVLKDPVNYGAGTKTILTEVAKRFHDALDDCEVQILDAKWYLEHQLEQNRLRREAKARELGTAAKRKHDEIEGKTELAVQENTPVKKAKVNETKTTQAEADLTKSTTTTVNASKTVADNQKEPKKEAPSKAKSPGETPVQDDFAKPTPQGSPAVTNDEFNFESMFGDTNASGGDNDLGFDLGLEGGFGDGQDPDSLDALIPGLEDFTQQPTDIPVSGAPGDALPAFSNDFDLPEIGGTNAFDDFLNDDNDQALLDMDFDDSLFN